MTLPIKEKIARGEVTLMINPDYPSPSLVEFIGTLGFDAVLIDCEHGMAGIERVQEMCRAARVAGTAAVVRPDANLPWLITRYLDAGAHGVMVPHIHTASAARELVDAVRYARPHDFGDKLVIALLESREAIENLDEILKVEGIDVFFVGPGDLANTLGLPGQRFHPTVRDLVLKACKQISDAGKAAGTLAKQANAREYVAGSVTFLYEHANAFLAEGAELFKRQVS